jgi:hypothetical protein
MLPDQSFDLPEDHLLFIGPYAPEQSLHFGFERVAV